MNTYFNEYLVMLTKSTGARELVSKNDRDYFLSNSDNPEDLAFLDYSEATPSEIADLSSFEFEQANYHDLVSFPAILLQSLCDRNISKEVSKNILEDVCGKMLQNI